MVLPNKDVPAGRTVKIARIQYGGTWDPEPGGWRRLSAILHNNAANGVELQLEPVKPGYGKLDRTFAAAHLTGTTKFTITEAGRAELKKYVEGGGTLIVDAAGGAAEFATSAEGEIAKIFGADAAAKLHALPLSHPLYSASHKIEAVEYRPWARRLLMSVRARAFAASTLAGERA